MCFGQYLFKWSNDGWFQWIATVAYHLQQHHLPLAFDESLTMTCLIINQNQNRSRRKFSLPFSDFRQCPHLSLKNLQQLLLVRITLFFREFSNIIAGKNCLLPMIDNELGPLPLSQVKVCSINNVYR